MNYYTHIPLFSIYLYFKIIPKKSLDLKNS